MHQPNLQLSIQTNAISMQDSSTMQVDQNENLIVAADGVQTGGVLQADPVIHNSKKLQDDLQMLGLKIKQHEDNIKLLKSQENKLDATILDLQLDLGKYHSAGASKIENDNQSSPQKEEETIEQILRHENSAAGIYCQLKTHLGIQASHRPLTKDVIGIVATLGKVEDANLSRLFSEYLGLDTMLAVVCKTYDAVKALETYDKEGCVLKSSGLHGLAASIGRNIDDRFNVICLEHLRPFPGDFVYDDPKMRLNILKPRLPSGEIPPGFLGYAVNMINIDSINLFYVTASGYGLRETLFYNIFSHLQVYRTREEMLNALPLIRDGAISLDGGMIKSTGVFSLGTREDIDVIFPSSETSNSSDAYVNIEKKIQETKWKKDKLVEDIQREQALLSNAKIGFARKKEEFVKFLAESSSYASQFQMHAAARDRMTPR